jgi:hypothetical protein
MIWFKRYIPPPTEEEKEAERIMEAETAPEEVKPERKPRMLQPVGPAPAPLIYRSNFIDDLRRRTQPNPEMLKDPEMYIQWTVRCDDVFARFSVPQGAAIDEPKEGYGSYPAGRMRFRKKSNLLARRRSHNRLTND